MIELTHIHKLTKDKTIAVAQSTVIAEHFNKRHDNVIQTIENLITENSGVKSMFIESEYNIRGRDFKQYLLTRDGYTLLAMGFTGAKALDFKLKYIKAFNLMEAEINKQQISRVDSKESFKCVMDALKVLKGNSIKVQHYTNEINMINKVILGMTAKKYKEVNNIEGDLRDYLESFQLEHLDLLEQYDEMLIKAGVDNYQVRKTKCEEHYKLIGKAVA